MNPPQVKNEKVNNHFKKTITFGIDHLNKRPRSYLETDQRKVIDITYRDIHATYRTWADKFLVSGYSIIFVYGERKKILQ